MKKTRFTDTQIITAIKQHDSGWSSEEICKEYGISKPAFYAWKKKFYGMDALQLKKLKELEGENKKLKQMYAVVCLNNVMLKDVLSKICKHW